MELSRRQLSDQIQTRIELAKSDDSEHRRRLESRSGTIHRAKYDTRVRNQVGRLHDARSGHPDRPIVVLSFRRISVTARSAPALRAVAAPHRFSLSATSSSPSLILRRALPTPASML